MNSKITIEVDFDNNNEPVIQIISRPSDDIRDKLIRAFIENLQYASNWCRMDWAGGSSEEGFQRWKIRPVKGAELKAQSEVMAEQGRLFEQQHTQ